MSKSGSDKKVANGLVAVSCAAVLAVYAAGYSRTRAAASQFEAQSAERRPAPSQARAATLPVEESTAARPSSVPEAAPAVEERVAPIAPEAVPSSPSNPTSTEVPPPIVFAAPTPSEVAVAPVAVTPAPAPVAAPAPQPVAPPPAPKWKDGTFTGWGTSRHGDIQAQVVIEEGRIQGATIIQCNTRYSCDVIDMLPPQVAARQSPDVDYVSRATESANAFYYAVVEAINKAK